MEYNVLIILDLRDASDAPQVSMFHEKLKGLEWSEDEPKANRWRYSFKNNVSFYNASKLIVFDLNKIKKYLQISEFGYAIQMDRMNIMTGIL